MSLIHYYDNQLYYISSEKNLRQMGRNNTPTHEWDQKTLTVIYFSGLMFSWQPADCSQEQPEGSVFNRYCTKGVGAPRVV